MSTSKSLQRDQSSGVRTPDPSDLWSSPTAPQTQAEHPPMAMPSPQVPASPPAPQGPVANVNVTTNVGGPAMVFTHHNSGPGFFIRALWYVCIGWWASALAIIAGYLAMLTLIGIPLAFFLFNRLPTLLTLRPRTQDWSVGMKNGMTTVHMGTVPQRPWWQRAVYFVFIGSWFGFVWLTLAWIIGIFILTLPLSFWMYNRVSGVMTLQRH